jgi:hypothetical protein
MAEQQAKKIGMEMDIPVEPSRRALRGRPWPPAAKEAVPPSVSAQVPPPTWSDPRD